METKENEIYYHRSKIKELKLAEAKAILWSLTNVGIIYVKVLERNNVTIEQLFKDQNKLPIQMCRHEINYVLYSLFAKQKKFYKIHRKMSFTLAEIGRMTGKNHCSVLNSVKVLNNEMDTRPKYKEEFMKFYNEILKDQVK